MSCDCDKAYWHILLDHLVAQYVICHQKSLLEAIKSQFPAPLLAVGTAPHASDCGHDCLVAVQCCLSHLCLPCSCFTVMANPAVQAASQSSSTVMVVPVLSASFSPFLRIPS